MDWVDLYTSRRPQILLQLHIIIFPPTQMCNIYLAFTKFWWRVHHLSFLILFKLMYKEQDQLWWGKLLTPWNSFCHVIHFMILIRPSKYKNTYCSFLFSHVTTLLQTELALITKVFTQHANHVASNRLTQQVCKAAVK